MTPLERYSSTNDSRCYVNGTAVLCSILGTIRTKLIASEVVSAVPQLQGKMTNKCSACS